MANIIQLKRSSVAGKIPAAANVSVGEPVVNLVDRVLYTKDGGGNVIQIAAGNLQGLADVSNVTPNVNDVITWTGTEWKPGLNFGNITSVNGEVGEVVLSTANIAESGNLYFTNARAYANVSGATLEFTGYQYYGSKTYTVTVAAKDATHIYNGTGSGDGYKLDGIFSPFLRLVPGVTYRFDQSDSSNLGHPLRFYLDAAKATQYTTGVTTNGTAGNSGAYTEIAVTDSTPALLYYQCSSHAYMGWGAEIATHNLSTLDTDDLSEGSNQYFTNARVYANIADLDSDSITEGSINLYFSNTRAINAFTAGQSITIDSNGLISSNATSSEGANLQTSNISELADVSDNVANTGQVLIWSGTEWEPNTITQNVTQNITLSNTFSNTFYTGANILSGVLESVEYTANGTGNTFILDFIPGKAESVFVFVDGIVQTANVHYIVDSNVLTLLGTPDTNAEVSVRYYDSAPAIKLVLGSLTEDTFTANGTGSTYILSKNVISNDSVMVFVNGVIQEGGNNYSVSGNILTFTSNPDTDANIFVRYFDTTGTSVAFGNVALNTTVSPANGQALVWSSANLSWEPGNVATDATTTSGNIAIYTRFEFTASANQTSFSGLDDNSKALSINNTDYAEVFLNGIRLVPNVDYSANETHVVLVEQADASDQVSIINLVDAVPEFVADTFTGDGTNTDFTMAVTPSNEASIIVSFDGVKQHTSEYSVSGNTLSFTTAPDASANIEVIHMASQVTGNTQVWRVANANITAESGYKYIVDTSSAPITITLPGSPITGDEVYFLDGATSFSSNNLTLARNGSNIMGTEDDLINNVDDAYVGLVYYNTLNGWRIVS